MVKRPDGLLAFFECENLSGVKSCHNPSRLIRSETGCCYFLKNMFLSPVFMMFSLQFIHHKYRQHCSIMSLIKPNKIPPNGLLSLDVMLCLLLLFLRRLSLTAPVSPASTLIPSRHPSCSAMLYLVADMTSLQSPWFIGNSDIVI